MRRRLALKLDAELPGVEALVVDDTGFPSQGSLRLRPIQAWGPPRRTTLEVTPGQGDELAEGHEESKHRTGKNPAPGRIVNGSSSDGVLATDRELYSINEDFSQASNLASTNPAKLKELQAAFDREAKKYGVYPLDSSLAERMDVRLRPSLTRGRSTFTYYPGTIRVPEGTAPDTKNKSWIVTAEVEIPAGGAEGVLITQGGRFGGWGLILMNGKPEFDYAFSQQPQHKYRVSSNETLAPGKHVIKLDFKYDGPGFGKSATGTLSVDGKQVAQAKIERTIPTRYSLDETMDVGEDTGTPVVEDYVGKMPFKFTGGLGKVTIELGKSGLSARDEKDLGEADNKLAGVRD
jgi:arylsulfatase